MKRVCPGTVSTTPRLASGKYVAACGAAYTTVPEAVTMSGCVVAAGEPTAGGMSLIAETSTPTWIDAGA